ncbi:hypothetical protein [Bacillus atrophaeus]|uniref:hypothetical protein n=1 Tax=Bacillus atrophaeus TaxID=1452 RepID=UPI003D1956CA
MNSEYPNPALKALRDIQDWQNRLQDTVNLPYKQLSLMLDQIAQQQEALSKSLDLTQNIKAHVNYIPNLTASIQEQLKQVRSLNLDINMIDFSCANEVRTPDRDEAEDIKYLQEAEDFINKQDWEDREITSEDINNTIIESKELNPFTRFYVINAIIFTIMMIVYTQLGGQDTLGIDFQQFVESYMSITAVGAIASKDK